MSIAAFLDTILKQKLTAWDSGLELDLIVLNQTFRQDLFNALAVPAPELAGMYKIVDGKGPYRDLYIHGVKVMWQGDRLPKSHCWYRYSPRKDVQA